MESGWKKGRKEGKERDETKELTDLSFFLFRFGAIRNKDGLLHLRSRA